MSITMTRQEALLLVTAGQPERPKWGGYPEDARDADDDWKQEMARWQEAKRLLQQVTR